MTFASQEMIDRMGAAGADVLAIAKQLVAEWMGEPAAYDAVGKLRRDEAVGRDLMMAVFLAARGDDVVNRLRMLQGMGHAIGESYAQQPPEVGEVILRMLRSGFDAGVAEQAARGVQTAGRA